MKRRISGIILLSIFLSLACSPAFASDKPEHDKLFEYIFFGQEDYKASRPDHKDAIGIIEYAAQLSIDQYEGNSSTYLKFLQNGGYIKCMKKYKITGLPESVNEIDIHASVDTHRNYTHMGWYCDKLSDFIDIDVNKNKEFLKIWNKRKDILRNTANAVFDFGWRIYGYDQRCDSFCALVYYTHILEDYLHDDYNKSQYNGHKILFASDTCNEDAHTLISEIIFYSKQIFIHKEQKHPEYDTFERKLRELNDNTYYLIGKDGSIDEDNYEKFHKNAEELEEILHENINYLLKKEKWFSDVFGK